EDANLHPGLMILEEGFAKITFKQGTQILLQAPCTFDLRSKNRMLLEKGMVTAQVPPAAHGFAIRTPHSTVTDFGTEFGLQVKRLQEAEVHVFDGRVQCRTAKSKNKGPAMLDITQGKAGVLSASGALTLKSLGSRPKLFVRELPDSNSLFSIPNRRLDLSDIVGGGSGFGTGQRHTCINPTTGELHIRYGHEARQGDGYVSVPALAMVDGVFVPSGKGGFMPISSSGYHYEFPPAAGGAWFVEVAHAGVANLDDATASPLVLGDQTFGQGKRPALLMHANVGITFDLDAVRDTLDGTRITSFSAYCGVSNRVKETEDPVTEFYVIVDGQVKFYWEIAMRSLPITRIQIRLNQDQRFLTLACLAGNKNYGDWSFFGEPALELEPAIE
ncbi:FecR domain-containing protein, partial [Planctomycetota bacterium]